MIEEGSINLPTDEQKQELRDDYIAAMEFLDSAIAAWPGMTGAQKQTWVAANLDTMMKIERALMRLLRVMLA